MGEPERSETRRAVLLLVAAAAVGARFFAAGVTRGNMGGALPAAVHPFPPLLGTAVGVLLAVRVGFIRRPNLPFARRPSIRPFVATLVGALVIKCIAALAFDSAIGSEEWIPALVGTLIWDVAFYGIAASLVLDVMMESPPDGEDISADTASE